MKDYILSIIGVTAIAYGLQPQPELPPLVVTYKHKQEVKEVQPQLPQVGELIHTDRVVNLSSREFNCLAYNIFYEAGVEDFAGKIAVAQVSNNRLKTDRYSNMCEVVYAHKQFSWTLSPDKRYKKPHGPLWEESIEAAKKFVDGMRVYGLEQVKHYHADYANPKAVPWTKHGDQVAQLGTHIFYANVQ